MANTKSKFENSFKKLLERKVNLGKKITQKENQIPMILLSQNII